ncbi:tyrosine--tRNA ligase [Chitinophagaceae bacterium LB-8]|uniref:Tyrosine--tRNA ligase n=1 Tax=Paraflavisolibacter caeni TaxID=2982496 RepID=A0A9X2XW51_9BACT|nr:tyrosine--tRNA ligase [Paraflavisolibacter caeni]MCU7550030.1 tyrosine--tRNA ligase [Paraflavisolibacter caeni]
MNLIEELSWRGMIQDIMPGTEDQLQKEMTSGYIGFDPTADSLHIGSLVPILLLVHLQRAGHKPYALVGGATGMVGDPSGRSLERNLLSEDVLQKNLEGIKSQLQKYLDFDSSKPTAAELVNNYDWFKNINFLDFIRDAGKHITVNYMLNKDSVRKRIESESGISFTEFTYQLIQGYDFYWLYQNKNCKLQMGGSDQWGNITTGTELIRRKVGGEAFAFTCPLITKADGGKFGKTEQGNIWLDPEKTTPYQFYQFWLNAADADAEKWIKIFTLLDRPQIEELIEKQKEDASKRVIQKALAKEATIFIHGEEEYKKAIETTEKLFSQQNAPAESLSIEDLESIQGIEKVDISKESLSQGIDIVNFLAETKIFPSKGEARKMIQNGGVSINRNKVQSLDFTIEASLLLHQQYLLIQKGKKNYYLVKVV